MKLKEKPFWKSKTMWVAILTVAGGICSGLAGEWTAAGVLTPLGVANIVLRVITKSQLK